MPASITLDGNKGQSVQVDLEPLDSAGMPTTDIGGHPVPTWTADDPAALVISDNINGSALPWQYTISLPTPPVAGTYTITATSLEITTTATVIVNYTAGPLAALGVSFGTPTPP
jgi:hypothetical protein